ncbi:MAG: aldose 1-epimerase family protein [Candidatus Dormibacteria bacterium]
MVPRPPSGDQIEIRHGEQRAVAVAVGGGLRLYEMAGRPVLDGYADDAIADGARGQLLVPWPNRVRDGAYGFQERRYQLPLSEPGQHNAIHGLARWLPWQVLRRADDRAALGLELPPQPGYPFQLQLEAEYRVGAAGLMVRQSATNIGVEPCPYGSGAHPYLRAPGDLLDDCVLTVPASATLTTDDRQIPAGLRQVAGTDLDFREPRPLGALRLDTAFTALEREAGCPAVVTLTGRDGTVELWVGPGHDYLMIFSGDTLERERRRRALAVEPMTCAPNAFNSGDGLRVLEPGETFAAEWGITVS